jgi:hypothetical protein
MLYLHIEDVELFDERKSEFFIISGRTIKLEHSLVSLSKWESKWCKPFLSKEPMTRFQTVDYIRHMTITQNVNPVLYNHIALKHINDVNEYIDHPMTATTFKKNDNRLLNREIITSEIIYYWMIALEIPFECQRWHLNRLLTLINVCNIKNQPNKTMSKKELLSRNHALNEARKRRFNTTG